MDPLKPYMWGKLLNSVFILFFILRWTVLLSSLGLASGFWFSCLSLCNSGITIIQCMIHLKSLLAICYPLIFRILNEQGLSSWLFKPIALCVLNLQNLRQSSISFKHLNVGWYNFRKLYLVKAACFISSLTQEGRMQAMIHVYRGQRTTF